LTSIVHDEDYSNLLTSSVHDGVHDEDYSNLLTFDLECT
jgi:hypothetical protein